MKKILGLDIGTNSIGWAFIETNIYEKPDNLEGKIIQLGSRIIPMDANDINNFDAGTPESKAATRRLARGARRLNQRYKLRRSRLITALKILGWLPDSFPTKFKKINKHNINEYLPYSDEIKKEVAEYFGIEGMRTTKGNEYELSEDWIIYYLKSKALNEKITLPELARVLYHANQRRGFKSSRKDNKVENEDNDLQIKYPINEKYIEVVKVTNIENKGKGEGKDSEFTFYEITCQTPELVFTSIKKRKNPLEWLGKDIEMEISKTTTKDQKVKYNISEVDPKEWESRKRAWEKYLVNEGNYISTTYFNEFKKDRNFTVKNRIVDRKFYQDELKAIWEKQSEFYKDIFEERNAISEIADTFYTHNSEKNKELKSKDLFHIFYNDIIYYQRGLKSQKSLIANCTFESKTYKDKDGNEKIAGIKVASKSSPAFQEFRIWQTIHNLKVLKNEETINDKTNYDIDYSVEFLTIENKEKLFELFDSTNKISHEAILRKLGLKPISGKFEYRLNYPNDKDFIGNETKAEFRKVFKKHNYIEEGNKLLQDEKIFYQLWHIMYSLQEENDIINALSNTKYFSIPEPVKKHLSKLPEYSSHYASFSYKALNKLLPLMRVGKYWNEEKIFTSISNTEIFKDLEVAKNDSQLPESLRSELIKRNIKDIYGFEGLPTFLASYIAYNRHSERKNEDKYTSFEDIKINDLIPYNSLRNPVVEKVIRETLKLVKEIWKNESLGRPDFIHVELGREMKNNAEERKKISEANSKNRIEKERIANLLKELKYPNFNADSPADIDKFRIWKDNGGKEGDTKFDELFKKNNSEFVKDADIEKYRLWAEQNYRSPYTGKVIKLSELFTEKYQIDHIIPKAKYYDDSFGNKVVVEAEVNALKGKRLAIQFIEDSQNLPIELTDGTKVTVFTLDDYKKNAEQTFTNKKKQRNLKLFEVPENFVERQLNDTKYISRTVAQFLRPIANGQDSDEGLIYTNGSITSDLKQKWGLNRLWKDLLRPRFERLETIMGEQLIYPSETKQGDYHFGKDYKRIDHRHHALDALIIACTSRSHIKYLNSLNSLSNDKRDKNFKEWEKWKYLLNKKKQLEEKENGMREFSLPWDNFFLDAKDAMHEIIISHKPTSKLVSKAINKYQKWIEVEPNKWEKKLVYQEQPQDDDKFWVAVRQSLFGQPLGKIHLAEYKKNVELKKAIKAQIDFIKTVNLWNSEVPRIALSKYRDQTVTIIKNLAFDEKAIFKYLENNPLIDDSGEIITSLDLLYFKKYASKRVSIDETFTLEKINALPYSNLQKNWLTNLLRAHLEENNNDPKVAFKGEALEQLFKKAPYPINKVTRKEGGDKIELNNKLLDGDKGVNQYFIIEISKEIDKKTGEEKIVRKYSTPKFLDCIERLAKKLPIHNDEPNKQYIVLSPGDVVYVPEPEENITQIDWNDKKKIASRCYIMKSSSASTCYFLPATVSTLIEKGEFESLGKSEKTIDGKQFIKEYCIKLSIDRLGNIIQH